MCPFLLHVSVSAEFSEFSLFVIMEPCSALERNKIIKLNLQKETRVNCGGCSHGKLVLVAAAPLTHFYQLIAHSQAGDYILTLTSPWLVNQQLGATSTSLLTCQTHWVGHSILKWI